MREASSGRVVEVAPVPRGLRPGGLPGRFTVLPVRTRVPVVAQVHAFAPSGPDPDYLLDRVGAREEGPLGRPLVQSLPQELADGVSVVAFGEAGGVLSARVSLARRAWDLDLLVTAATDEVDVVQDLYEALCELLAAVHPAGDREDVGVASTSGPEAAAPHARTPAAESAP